MTCIVLRGRWRNIIVLSVHAPSEDKSDDPQERFYMKLKQVFFIIFLGNLRKLY
jgi:hypothetical protein